MRVLFTREVERATPRTRRIRIDLDETPFPFRAGQAVVVGLQDSPIRQPYSIACSPRQAEEMRALELLVQIEDTGLPDPHLERAAPHTPLSVAGPFGTFGLPQFVTEPDVLFVAGGTGISPLRAMMWDVFDRQPDKRVSLLYSARSADEFAYEPELRDLAARDRLHLRMTVSRDESGRWTGLRGRIDAGLIAEMLRTSETRCAICGPRAMVDTAVMLLKAAGVTDEKIVTETFSG